MRYVVILCLFATATQAEPRPSCGPHDAQIAFLISEYGETVQASGVTYKREFMELMGNRKTDTWTLVLTTLDGIACFMTVGGFLKQTPPGDPA